MVTLDAPSACSGVFFHCDLIGPHVLPKAEMKAKIKEFLYEQAQEGEEKGLTACLIIHTMAKNQDAVRIYTRPTKNTKNNYHLGNLGEDEFA